MNLLPFYIMNLRTSYSWGAIQFQGKQINQSTKQSQIQFLYMGNKKSKIDQSPPLIHRLIHVLDNWSVVLIRFKCKEYFGLSKVNDFLFHYKDQLEFPNP